MMPPMRFFYYLGGFLLVLVFGSAAAEATPRSMSSGGWFVSAYELWYTFLPGNLVVTQIQVGEISPALWDPLLVSLLSLPALFFIRRPGRDAGVVLPAQQRNDGGGAGGAEKV